MEKDYYNSYDNNIIPKLKTVELLPNILFIVLSSILIFYYARIPFAKNGSAWTSKFCIATLFIMVLLQFVVCPLTSSLVLKETADYEFKEHADIITPQERTFYIKNLMQRPLQLSLHDSYTAFAVFFAHMFLSVFYFKCGFVLSAFIFCSFFLAQSISSVLVYIFSENVCSKKVNELIKKDIDKNIINRDKFYGLKLYLRIFFHIIMPFLFSTLYLLFFIWKEMKSGTPKNILVQNVTHLVSLNFVICFLLSFFFYRHIITSTNNCIRALENLTNNNHEDNVFLPVDLGYELEYNIFQIKEILYFWQNLVSEANQASKNILSQTSNLVSLANENATTTSIENEKVKDNLDYITNITKTSKDITEKINSVHSSAESTQSSIYQAIVLLQQEINKMTTITNANLLTITGIKNLNSKIEEVCHVIKKIEMLAEKDKMIAFNAELKINAAEEEGQNFHIIAYSLRRLVATVKSSTIEINKSLKSIQETADNLIITSEGGTQKIRGGSNFYTGLEEHFKTMLTSSDITLESVTSIQERLHNQYTAFLQINSSLSQMNAGFEQFASNTQTIQKSSAKLIKTANDLYQANSGIRGNQ